MYCPARSFTARARFSGLRAGSRHDRLVVIDREHVEHHFCGGRTRGPQKRLGVPCAVLEFQPHEHRLVGLRHRTRDLRRHGVLERKRRSHRRAERHEVTARHTVPCEFRLEPGLARSSRTSWPPRRASTPRQGTPRQEPRADSRIAYGVPAGTDKGPGTPIGKSGGQREEPDFPGETEGVSAVAEVRPR